MSALPKPAMQPALRWALWLTLAGAAVLAAWPEPEPVAERMPPVAVANGSAGPGGATDATGAAGPADPVSRPQGRRPGDAGGAAAWPQTLRPRAPNELPQARASAAWAAQVAPWPAAPRTLAPAAAATAAAAQPVLLANAAPEEAPLPFTLIGLIDEGAGARALLMSAQRTLAVKAGDQIDGGWRVVSIQPQGVSLQAAGEGGERLLSFKKP